MTAEEYVVKRLEELEAELAQAKEENAKLIDKLVGLRKENGRLNDQLGDIAELLNPHISRLASGTEVLECNAVFGYEKDGQEKIEKLSKLFGLEVEK